MMTSARIATMVLLTLLAAACGGTEDRTDDGVTSNTGTVEAEGTVPTTEAPAAGDGLDREYLTGEWCARETTRPTASGTTWVFAEDGTTRRGKGEALSDGGDVETFIMSSETISVEPDAFVISQAGIEMRFERRPCSG